MEDLREVTSFSSRAMALGRISKLRKTKYDFYVAGDSSNFVFLEAEEYLFYLFFCFDFDFSTLDPIFPFS